MEIGLTISNGHFRLRVLVIQREDGSWAIFDGRRQDQGFAIRGRAAWYVTISGSGTPPKVPSELSGQQDMWDWATLLRQSGFHVTVERAE